LTLTQVREGRHAALLAEWEDWCDARFGRPAMPRWRAAIMGDELGVMREACFLRLAMLP
jgi:hypothetical protein